MFLSTERSKFTVDIIINGWERRRRVIGVYEFYRKSFVPSKGTYMNFSLYKIQILQNYISIFFCFRGPRREKRREERSCRVLAVFISLKSVHVYIYIHNQSSRYSCDAKAQFDSKTMQQQSNNSKDVSLFSFESFAVLYYHARTNA